MKKWASPAPVLEQRHALEHLLLAQGERQRAEQPANGPVEAVGPLSQRHQAEHPPVENESGGAKGEQGCQVYAYPGGYGAEQILRRYHGCAPVLAKRQW